jgi:hypothetical protein
MSIKTLLNTTVNVQTQTATKSVLGGAGASWSAKASNAPARVMQLDADVVEAYGRLGYKVSHRVYFDTDYSISAKDRIIHDGTAYEVHSVNNAGGHMDRLWHVDVNRLPLGA